MVSKLLSVTLYVGIEMKILLVPLLIVVVQLARTHGGACLQDGACRGPDGNVTGSRVGNVTYCCPHGNDYLHLIHPQNHRSAPACLCTTTAIAAAHYADRTMDQGQRTCNRGQACEGVEEQLTPEGSNQTFCCPGKRHFLRLTRFGSRDVVCRCQGSVLPPRTSDVYAPPPTGNASSSGEPCSYNYGCAHIPSNECYNDKASFCCYGSRGLETINDLHFNVTRCTCTNDFEGVRCDAQPFVIDNETDARCRSGDDCDGVDPSFTCSHGNSVFCCPRHGINLTIVDDVISDCACVSAGGQCNVTMTSSGVAVSLCPALSACLWVLAWWVGLVR